MGDKEIFELFEHVFEENIDSLIELKGGRKK